MGRGEVVVVVSEGCVMDSVWVCMVAYIRHLWRCEVVVRKETLLVDVEWKEEKGVVRSEECIDWMDVWRKVGQFMRRMGVFDVMLPETRLRDLLGLSIRLWGRLGPGHA